MLSADMAVQTVSLYSYGFQATSADPNALSDLELALLNHPEADSLFVFSDLKITETLISRRLMSESENF